MARYDDEITQCEIIIGIKKRRTPLEDQFDQIVRNLSTQQTLAPKD
jgi:hypothetical protein